MTATPPHPDQGTAHPFTTAGVVGAGLMGRAIAAVFARHGLQVRLFDNDPRALDRAAGALRDQGLAVTAVADLAAVARGADLVTEAIAENLSVKQHVFTQLDAADPDAVLATNTSVLPISQIAEKTVRPQRVVGTHWWNPPDVMPLVEVIPGTHTSEAVMTSTIARLTALGKLAVRVDKDVPGFVGNRLQHALWREAISLVADGVCDARTVDLVVRATIGLRLAQMGPIENADFVGLDLTLAIHEAVLPAINRDPGPSPLLRELVAQGNLGAKTGRGLLSWQPGDRDAAAAALAAHVRRQLAGRPDDDPIADPSLLTTPEQHHQNQPDQDQLDQDQLDQDQLDQHHEHHPASDGDSPAAAATDRHEESV